MSLPRLDFVLAGSSSLGMGHVMRCAALARSAAARGFEVGAFIEGEPVAFERWREASGGQAAHDWSAWSPPTSGACTVVLDYPARKDAWLRRLESLPLSVVVLDDDRYRSQVALTICPGLHHPTSTPEAASQERLLSGPSYAILGAAHRGTSPPPLSDRDRVLLSMGGADPHHATPRIAPTIMNAALSLPQPLRPVRFDVILGPAFRDEDRAIAKKLNRGGWTVHQNLDAHAMVNLMSTARFAVIGFGTSLCELAVHGTPFASVTHHVRDEAPSQQLEASGIGLHLAFAGDDLGDDRVERRIARALEDAKWQSESAALALAAVAEGRGVERILDRIEALG